ncbi:hypothetical protein DRQ25_12885 [Candidatus Fermentibacteria bacterium]|nr:MAG: hypothetical protein DRQ25_12885 [Candidatus Fermentibacteria bacterium]
MPTTIIVRARQSSRAQQVYFGTRAWRPYLFIYLKNPAVPPSDSLVHDVIEASFYNEPVQGVDYQKIFNLIENEVFEFSYAMVYYDKHRRRYHYSRYIPIHL